MVYGIEQKAQVEDLEQDAEDWEKKNWLSVCESVKKLLLTLNIGSEPETIANCCGSGDSIELSPENVALYNYIMGASFAKRAYGIDFDEKLWNSVREYFMGFYPQTYRVLID